MTEPFLGALPDELLSAIFRGADWDYDDDVRFNKIGLVCKRFASLSYSLPYRISLSYGPFKEFFSELFTEYQSPPNDDEDEDGEGPKNPLDYDEAARKVVERARALFSSSP